MVAITWEVVLNQTHNGSCYMMSCSNRTQNDLLRD